MSVPIEAQWPVWLTTQGFLDWCEANPLAHEPYHPDPISSEMATQVPPELAQHLDPHEVQVLLCMRADQQICDWINRERRAPSFRLPVYKRDQLREQRRREIEASMLIRKMAQEARPA